jgi:hypothetical protein
LSANCSNSFCRFHLISSVSRRPQQPLILCGSRAVKNGTYNSNSHRVTGKRYLEPWRVGAHIYLVFYLFLPFFNNLGGLETCKDFCLKNWTMIQEVYLLLPSTYHFCFRLSLFTCARFLHSLYFMVNLRLCRLPVALYFFLLQEGTRMLDRGTRFLPMRNCSPISAIDFHAVVSRVCDNHILIRSYYPPPPPPPPFANNWLVLARRFANHFTRY